MYTQSRTQKCRENGTRPYFFPTEMHLILFIHFVKRCREWKQGHGNFAAVTFFLGMILAEGDKIGTYGSLSAMILSCFTLLAFPRQTLPFFLADRENAPGRDSFSATHFSFF